MDDERVKGYRNFATKLWNATRFCQTNGITASTTLEAPAATSAVNRWIIGEVAEALAKLDEAMADLRFDAASNIIYHFTWDTFCDWYIELIKPVSGANFDDESKAVAGWVLDQILVMLHPFMPFVTEELWGAQGDRANYPLITAKWPEFSASVDADAKAEVEWLIGLTSAVRGAKNELGVPPGQKLEAYCPEPSALAADAIARNSAAIERLARISTIHTKAAPDGAAMQIGAGTDTLVIPLEGLVDIEAEKARLTTALEISAKEAKSLEGRLGNANFVERAKPEAVEKAKADHAHHSAEVERLKAALERLG
jgi:valyl-tRNA synthetase